MTQPTDAVRVRVVRDADAQDLPLPEYQTAGSAGMDLRAAVGLPVVLAPGSIVLIPTGLRIAIPPGYEAQIRPRSGLALRHGITLPNSPATIDSDYRGPLSVIVANYGRHAFTIRRGDRIAQMIVAPVARVAWDEVDGIDETARGDGGFGHTGAS